MSREPIFNVPGVVLVVLALLAGIHVGLEQLAAERAEDLRLALAFIPARYTGQAGALPGGPLAEWTSIVTHQWVHGDYAHLGINAAWMLAFGSAVAARVGALRFVALATVCGMAGAALFAALHWGEPVPMVGASGAISGLMGAGFRLIFPAIQDGELGTMHDSPRALPLAPLSVALRNQQLVKASGLFIAVNLVLAFVGHWITDAGGIAWEAHLGGFFVGLLGFGLFDRRPSAHFSQEV